MYSLDEAQKGVGGKPANQKEIQRVYRLLFYFCKVNFSRHKNKSLFFLLQIESQIVKIKENLEKSETKYHKACANVELARQDWQIETYKVNTLIFDI